MVILEFCGRGGEPICSHATKKTEQRSDPLRANCWSRIVASPYSSAAVVAAQARGGEPLHRRQEAVPCPGTRRWGRAYTFAGRGTSVSCLATYKPRRSCTYNGNRRKYFCLLLNNDLRNSNHAGGLTRLPVLKPHAYLSKGQYPLPGRIATGLNGQPEFRCTVQRSRFSGNATSIMRVDEGPKTPAWQSQTLQMGATVSGQKITQWLFLTHIFSHVILEDRAALGASGRSNKSTLPRKILYAVLTAVAFTWLIGMLVKMLLKRGVLDGGCLTVTGHTLAENVATWPDMAANQQILAPWDQPLKTTGHIRILRGTLAPEGAVAKITGKEGLRFSGPARVYDSEEDMIRGVEQNQVRKGDVVVIRYEGPKGGPGMPEMLAPTSVIIGAGLGQDVALITDGRFSGGSHGFIIGHVTPEAQAGGPIALVQDGDRITIDSENSIIDVDISTDELAKRRAQYVPKPLKVTSGALYRYVKSVKTASEGCVTDE